MTQFSYLNALLFVLPELVLTLGVLAVLFVDLGIMRGESIRLRRLVGAIVVTASAGAAILCSLGVVPEGSLPEGILISNPINALVRQSLIVLAAIVAWLSVESDFTDHTGEFFALILLGTIGLMLMAASENLLMIFVSLEMSSLTLYILTAMDRRRAQGAEAALKYFLFGGMAAAATAYGFSLLYGASGRIDLAGIADALRQRPADPVLLIGMVMSVAGLGFKIAAVPFHLWAPDAYHAAPAPCAAFISSGSKVASFVVLAKLTGVGLAAAAGSAGWKAAQPGWAPALAMIAVASMVLGNLAALAQGDLRRLLAYSAVAHAGYGLLGVIASTPDGMASIVYFSVTYALTAAGAFGCVACIEADTGSSRIDKLAGLSRRSPLLAFFLLVLLLSLAGIPPLPGFFGKFYLFTAAASAGKLSLLWLVILAIAMSTVSLYYYLKVLKQVYVATAPEPTSPLVIPLANRLVLSVVVSAVILAGVFPAFILARITP